MALRALIIDDEMHARENLRMLLDEFCPEVEVVALAGGVEEGLRQVSAYRPDVVFLDIRMPSGSEGFDFIERSGSPDFLVVFVTAFKDYAVQAFNANAIHYVLKPIDIDDLREAVKKLLDYKATFESNAESQPIYVDSLKQLSTALRTENRPKRITLHHAKGFKIMVVNDIARLESDGACTRLFFTDGNSFLDSRHLKIYEDLLDPKQFCRVHRSHIINLEELREYLHTDGHTAVLNDGTHIPVARARVSDFLTRVKNL